MTEYIEIILGVSFGLLTTLFISRTKFDRSESYNTLDLTLFSLTLVVILFGYLKTNLSSLCLSGLMLYLSHFIEGVSKKKEPSLPTHLILSLSSFLLLVLSYQMQSSYLAVVPLIIIVLLTEILFSHAYSFRINFLKGLFHFLLISYVATSLEVQAMYGMTLIVILILLKQKIKALVDMKFKSFKVLALRSIQVSVCALILEAVLR